MFLVCFHVLQREKNNWWFPQLRCHLIVDHETHQEFVLFSNLSLYVPVIGKYLVNFASSKTCQDVNSSACYKIPFKCGRKIMKVLPIWHSGVSKSAVKNLIKSKHATIRAD